MDKEREVTKAMLNKISLIREANFNKGNLENDDNQPEEDDLEITDDGEDNGNEYNEIDNSRGEDGIPITDDSRFGNKIMTTQMNAIRKVLKQNVTFPDNPLIFYPETKNLIFTGEIPDLNNLKWQFSLNDSSGRGCYIYVQNLQLTDENVKTINLLKNYYENWKNELSTNPPF